MSATAPLAVHPPPNNGRVSPSINTTTFNDKPLPHAGPSQPPSNGYSTLPNPPPRPSSLGPSPRPPLFAQPQPVAGPSRLPPPPQSSDAPSPPPPAATLQTELDVEPSHLNDHAALQARKALAQQLAQQQRTEDQTVNGGKLEATGDRRTSGQDETTADAMRRLFNLSHGGEGANKEAVMKQVSPGVHHVAQAGGHVS